MAFILSTSLRSRLQFMAGAMLGLFGAPAVADAPGLMALESLQSGLWTLRSRDSGDGPPFQQFCLGDPRVLLQLRHEGQQCSRFVIANDPKTLTVSYSCAGRGHGRTTLRAETPRLIQIESQGVADRMPFQWMLEARRIGECPRAAVRREKQSLPLTLR